MLCDTQIVHENVDFSENDVGYGVVQNDGNEGIWSDIVISGAYHEDMDHARVNEILITPSSTPHYSLFSHLI